MRAERATETVQTPHDLGNTLKATTVISDHRWNVLVGRAQAKDGSMGPTKIILKKRVSQPFFFSVRCIYIVDTAL